MITGLTRYRVQPWTKLLILQVQFKGTYDDICGPCVGTRDYISWRDATIIDLQALDGSWNAKNETK